MSTKDATISTSKEPAVTSQDFSISLESLIEDNRDLGDSINGLHAAEPETVKTAEDVKSAQLTYKASVPGRVCIVFDNTKALLRRKNVDLKVTRESIGNLKEVPQLHLVPHTKRWIHILKAIVYRPSMLIESSIKQRPDDSYAVHIDQFAIVMCHVDTGDRVDFDFTVNDGLDLDYTLKFTPDPYRMIVQQQLQLQNSERQLCETVEGQIAALQSCLDKHDKVVLPPEPTLPDPLEAKAKVEQCKVQLEKALDKAGIESLREARHKLSHKIQTLSQELSSKNGEILGKVRQKLVELKTKLQR